MKLCREDEWRFTNSLFHGEQAADILLDGLEWDSNGMTRVSLDHVYLILDAGMRAAVMSWVNKGEI